MVKLYVITDLGVLAFLLDDLVMVMSHLMHEVLSVQQLKRSCHPSTFEEVQEPHVFEIQDLHERKDRYKVYFESACLNVMKGYLCQVSFWL